MRVKVGANRNPVCANALGIGIGRRIRIPRKVCLKRANRVRISVRGSQRVLSGHVLTARASPKAGASKQTNVGKRSGILVGEAEIGRQVSEIIVRG